MAFLDLVPWGRARFPVPTRLDEDADPFLALHREMNRLFSDFNRGFGGLPAGRKNWAAAWPTVEVTETDQAVTVIAELPGLEQKDIELSLKDGVLTLKGEKKAETRDALYSERWHGQFQRALEVGAGIDPEKVSAAFKDGVLTVTLAKIPETVVDAKRIPISKG